MVQCVTMFLFKKLSYNRCHKHICSYKKKKNRK